MCVQEPCVFLLSQPSVVIGNSNNYYGLLYLTKEKQFTSQRGQFFKIFDSKANVMNKPLKILKNAFKKIKIIFPPNTTRLIVNFKFQCTLFPTLEQLYVYSVFPGTMKCICLSFYNVLYSFCLHWLLRINNYCQAIFCVS